MSLVGFGLLGFLYSMNRNQVVEKLTRELRKGIKSLSKLTSSEITSNIEVLTEFCSRHSWEVVYSDKKEDYYHNNVIHLYRVRREEILYYMLLHEIGHAWLLECDFTYKDRYPELVRNPLRYATVTYKIAKVQEEIEAWDVGNKLAQSLGLRINPSKFEKIRAECLSGYMNWAGKPRKRNGSTTANQQHYASDGSESLKEAR